MIYIYQGAEFTEEQVSQAAANLGLTVEEYKNKYKLTVKQEDPVGKTTTTGQGALVGGMLAPAELSQTSSLSDLGLTSVSQDNQIATAPSQTTADSLLLTEEERNEQKNLISDVGLSVAGSFINVAADLAAIPQQMAYLGWEAYDPSRTLAERKRKIDQIEAIGNMVGMVPGVGGMIAMSPGKAQKVQDAIEGAKKKYKDEDILAAIQNGNYGDAAAMTVRGVAESASSYAAAAFGWPGMLLLGGAYASDKFQQEILDSEKSVGRIAAASVLTGASEAALERVTQKLFFNAKKIGNAEKARKFLEKGLLLTYGKFFGKTQVEALSEDTTEGINMLIDKFMLGKKITGKEVRHRLFQAHTLGTAGAATIQGVQDYSNKGKYTERMATQVLHPPNIQKAISRELSNVSKSLYNVQKAKTPVERTVQEAAATEATNNALNIMARADVEIKTLKGDAFKKYAKNRDLMYELSYDMESNNLEGDDLDAALKQFRLLKAENDLILKNSVKDALDDNITATTRYAEELKYTVKQFNTSKEFDNYKASQGMRVSDSALATFATEYNDDMTYIPEQSEILINRQRTLQMKGITSPQHEVLHGILRNTLDTNPKAAIDMTNAIDQIVAENIGSREFINSKYYDRLVLYANTFRQKDIAGENRTYREEMITTLSDALATRDLILNESAADKLGRTVRRILYNYAGVNRKFNKPQDVVDFIIDFNRSIEKGYIDKSIVRIAEKGAKGDIFRPLDDAQQRVSNEAADAAFNTKQELIARNKELLAQADNKKENFTEQQLVEYNENVQKIKNLNEALQPKVPKGVSVESAKLSETVQAIYNEKGVDGFFDIAKNMDKFVNKVVNELYKENSEFAEQAMTKDDFKFTLIYGAKRYRKSNTLLQLVSTYNPEKGKTLSQYIMANLKNRGKGLLQQVIGMSPTTGATRIDQAVDSDGASTVDRMEELSVEADFDNIPVAAERRAVSLELKRSFVKGIKEEVETELKRKLPIFYSQDFKIFLRDRFRQTLNKGLKEAVPSDPATKRGRREKGLEYTEWVKRNIRGIYETFTEEKTIAATMGDLRDLLLDDTKKKLKSFEEVRDDLLEYYIAPKSKTSSDIRKRTVVSPQLKSQHRTQLINQIADAIGFDAAADVLRSDSKIGRIFKKNQEAAANETLFGAANISNQDIIAGTIDVLNDKIRNINILGNFDSKTNDEIKRVSFALAEFKASNKKMNILEINELVKEALGIEYQEAQEIVLAQQELILYQAQTDVVDRAKLRELYDKAKNSVSLNVDEEANISDFNKFEELYMNTVAGTKKTFNAGNKQDYINFVREYHIERGLEIPKGLTKMKIVELEDMIDNLDMSTRKSKKAVEDQIEKNKTVLDREFNEILELRTGIKASETIYKADAHYNAKKETFLEPLNIFLPYNAEDFQGLIYKFLPKGKKGEQAHQWFKDNIFNEFAKGNYNATIYKQALFRDYKQLKESLGITDSYLKTKIGVAGLTKEQAIRLYLWDSNGELPKLDLEGVEQVLSPQDVDALRKEIQTDKKLTTIASHLQMLTKRHQIDGKGKGYVPYDDLWIGGTISTDLITYANGPRRKHYLAQWRQNIDEIFNKRNKSKIKLIYGKSFLTEIEKSIDRQWSGKNIEPTSKLDRNIHSWINGSVGAIMFLNMKSAALQTISTANFVNMTDNNVFKASAAFANQKQYWKDFMMLMNSDYLKNRRDGLAMQVEADEVARAASGRNGATKLFNQFIKKGYTPTKVMDSFAIAFGGATFYRNRYNRYIKEGMTEQEANKQALLDFQEKAEESQQSARGDRVSSIQTAPMGKLILAFANTPLQYARLTKRAGQDLIMGRGDAKEHIAKIAYYSFVQSLFFNALSNMTDYGLSNLLDDEELTPEETKQLVRAVNGSIDGYMRGFGIGGNVFVGLKNIYLAVEKAYEDGKMTTEELLDIVSDEGTAISPAINSKLRKIISGGKKFVYRDSLRDMDRKKWYDPTNPRNEAWVQIGSAITNLPGDRLYRKLDALSTAAFDDIEAWQRLALVLGWDKWTIGVEKQKKKKKRRSSGRGSGRAKG